MKTLKELRTEMGISQGEVSRKLGIYSSQYSLYESGQMMLPLEDMILLEREFSQPIDWQDQIPEKDKQEIALCINSLIQHYPLEAVLRFVDKNLKQGIKINSPGKLIKFFTNQAGKGFSSEEPLELPTIKFRKK